MSPCAPHGWVYHRQIAHYNSDGIVEEITVRCPTCGYFVWPDEADEADEG